MFAEEKQHFCREILAFQARGPPAGRKVGMAITHAQLRSHGMTDRMEAFFKLDEIEWQRLGKGATI